MTVKRHALIILAVAVAAGLLLAPGVAFANYSIHGSYTMSTDACAGCHRAHTAASPITWVDTTGADNSALLVATSSTYNSSSIKEFCYTCHGDSTEGADTNVEAGVFEGDDEYNDPNEPLNGGAFGSATSSHAADPADWKAYGGGTTGLDADGYPVGGFWVTVSCTVCHDVHGSSNYRLLKDAITVNLDAPYTVQVGGYDYSVDPQNPTPRPYVISSEVGYPTEGWRLHEPGAAQVAGYKPDYTTPRYAKAPGNDPTKGISAWCAACHTQYVSAESTYAAGDTELLGVANNYVVRHRHPVNVPLSNYTGYRALIVTDNPLPLAHGPSDSSTNDPSDWIDCLTCHVAHGTSAIMTGYAALAVPTLDPDDPTNWSGGPVPAQSSALLRGNNRYVCEACHNK